MIEKNNQKLLVSKSYILNSMRNGYKTLREQRLFAMYLAKINPTNPETNTIKFSLENFTTLCGISQCQPIKELKSISKRLLQKVVTLETHDGGFCHFTLFDHFKLAQDKNTLEWFFEITASRSGMNFFFELKSHYFKYDLKYILKLKSINQIRLYEILKQREKTHIADISLFELKELLFIEATKYKRFDNFNKCVLKPCCQIISELTDIKVNYTLKRTGRKISSIVFAIISKEINTINDSIAIFCDQEKVKKNTKRNKLWKHALEIAINTKNKKPMLSVSTEKYALGILRKWHNMKIETIDDLKSLEIYSDIESKYIKNSMYCIDSAYDINDL